MKFFKSKKGLAVIAAAIVGGLAAAGIITQEQAVDVLTLIGVL